VRLIVLLILETGRNPMKVALVFAKWGGGEFLNLLKNKPTSLHAVIGT
jgi:hypothetical protein